jgi:hypothetical protein
LLQERPDPLLARDGEPDACAREPVNEGDVVRQDASGWKHRELAGALGIRELPAVWRGVRPGAEVEAGVLCEVARGLGTGRAEK